MKRIKKGYEEFWAERLHIRWKPDIVTPEDPSSVCRQEADFIKDVLSLGPEKRALDLGCGAGEHCLFLAEQGVRTTGIDIAPVLIEYARGRAKEAEIPAKFLCADMRTFRTQPPFDAIFTSSGTFGMFDDAGNRAVLQTISAALVPGGRFLIGPSGPSLLESESFRHKTWVFVDDGCLLIEQRWDRATSLFHETLLLIDETGAIIEMAAEDEERWWESAKPYSVAQLKEMIDAAGLTFTAAYGSFEIPLEPYGPDSARILVVGQKRNAA